MRKEAKALYRIKGLDETVAPFNDIGKTENASGRMITHCLPRVTIFTIHWLPPGYIKREEAEIPSCFHN